MFVESQKGDKVRSIYRKRKASRFMEADERKILLTKLYNEHQPIRLGVGVKFPVQSEVVAAGNGKRCSEKQWFEHDGNYGIRTGSISDGFEVIDFDPKNYGDNESKDPEEKHRRSSVLMKE